MKNNKVFQLLSQLDKKNITEIMINDADKFFVEQDGTMFLLNVDISVKDIQEFVHLVYKFNNKNIKNNYILDGRLPDKSRVNIVLPPFCKKNPAITIRKHIKSFNSFSTEKKYFSVDQKSLKLLQAIVDAKCNVIITGGTSSGKTTFLNSMINLINKEERVVCIEDTLEINTSLINIVRIETGNNLSAMNNDNNNYNLNTSDFIRSALRMRPDRIIIGEIRGGEMFDLLQAMNTGHNGSMTSLHANVARDVFSRMENLFLMSGYNLDVKVIRSQISHAIDFIINLGKNSQGQKSITSIMEVTGIEGSKILSQQIVLLGDNGPYLTGLVPECIDKLCLQGKLNRDYFNK